MLKTKFRRFLSSFISIVLITATALVFYGCNDSKNKTGGNDVSPSVTQAQTVTEMGEGKNYFNLTVTDLNGQSSQFSIKTDKTTVGDALQELGLIEGEDGQYGLYVKKVNGISADYDTDKTYWAFYIDNELAMSGIDATDIVNGTSYALKIEK